PAELLEHVPVIAPGHLQCTRTDRTFHFQVADGGKRVVVDRAAQNRESVGHLAVVPLKSERAAVVDTVLVDATGAEWYAAEEEASANVVQLAGRIRRGGDRRQLQQAVLE